MNRAARLIASTLFVLATVLSGTAALAQQVTYYDFDTAPANSSYTCSPTSATNPLFCLNDGTGNERESFFPIRYLSCHHRSGHDGYPAPSEHAHRGADDSRCRW